jgi:hypothetical protein
MSEVFVNGKYLLSAKNLITVYVLHICKIAKMGLRKYQFSNIVKTSRGIFGPVREMVVN